MHENANTNSGYITRITFVIHSPFRRCNIMNDLYPRTENNMFKVKGGGGGGGGGGVRDFVNISIHVKI